MGALVQPIRTPRVAVGNLVMPSPSSKLTLHEGIARTANKAKPTTTASKWDQNERGKAAYVRNASADPMTAVQ
jgi:hypothetical protein